MKGKITLDASVRADDKMRNENPSFMKHKDKDSPAHAHGSGLAAEYLSLPPRQNENSQNTETARKLCSTVWQWRYTRDRFVPENNIFHSFEIRLINDQRPHLCLIPT